MRHLEESLAGFLLADEAAGDELHEEGEVFPEPRPLLSEERRLGDAAGVDGGEGDARLLVVLGMEEVGEHHQAAADGEATDEALEPRLPLERGQLRLHLLHQPAPNPSPQ